MHSIQTSMGETGVYMSWQREGAGSQVKAARVRSTSGAVWEGGESLLIRAGALDPHRGAALIASDSNVEKLILISLPRRSRLRSLR